MRLALISVSIEQAPSQGPVGLLPLFDETIVQRQVRSAQQMGADKIVLLSPTMHGALLQYVDALKIQNIDAEIARNSDHLQQYATDEDELLYLGDGILPGEVMALAVREESAEMIQVVGNADDYSSFERIDLNHRWLGIALLKASRLAEISDIPEDWDIGSALLRTAVQSDCRRDIVSDDRMKADNLVQLLTEVNVQQYTQRRLEKAEIPKQNFLDRFLVWPATRKLIPLLWRAPDAKKYTGIAALACNIIALTMGLVGWPILALAFLLISALVLNLNQRISIFGHSAKGLDWGNLLFNILAIATLAVVIWHHAPSPIFGAEQSLLILLSCILWLVDKAPDGRKITLIKPDRQLILLFFFLFSIAGFFAVGLYLLTLYAMAYLVLVSRDRFSQISEQQDVA
ncbi:MAG: hypothetical protein ABJO01_00550 [Parasphingorhabdus sp.]|uniref:hypothetical protein n=1 Tax=Parasphingorhabdus sp. TaxID=2709688 RepID=UPI0032988190